MRQIIRHLVPTDDSNGANSARGGETTGRNTGPSNVAEEGNMGDVGVGATANSGLTDADSPPTDDDLGQMTSAPMGGSPNLDDGDIGLAKLGAANIGPSTGAGAAGDISSSNDSIVDPAPLGSVDTP